jgi:hypothetical protein
VPNDETDPVENFLAHFGIKGMKWDKTKPKPKLTPEQAQNLAKLQKAHPGTNLTVDPKLLNSPKPNKVQSFLQGLFGSKTTSTNTVTGKKPVTTTTTKPGSVDKLLKKIFKNPMGSKTTTTNSYSMNNPVGGTTSSRVTKKTIKK